MATFVIRIIKFYVGWRLPLVLGALVMGYLGLSTDEWWSPLLALSGALPLLALYALTASRVGDQQEVLEQHENRVAANERRLEHAEDRDGSFEHQLGAVKKSLKQLSALAATAKSAKSARPRPGDEKRGPKATSVATGQVMSQYNIATESSVDADAPLVTVVIPCFNERRFVGDAIASLKAQTFANFVAIVVDDTSTDDSVAVAIDAVAGDRRFHIVRHAINSGLSAARNTGLRLARTPYVCFLDADDFFHVDNLEERIRHLIGYADATEVVGVYSGIEHVSEHVTFGDVGPSSPAIHRSETHDHLSVAGSCPFNCHAPLLRTEVLQRFGGFDESMRQGAEDWECWQRLLRHGYIFHATPSVLAVYRQKAASMVRSMPGQHLAEGDRLLGAVHESLEPSAVVPGTPYVFDRPLGHYQHNLLMTERVLEFMGLAYMTEDAAQIDAAFARIDPAFWPVAERNLPVSALLDSGIRRGYALDKESFEHLGGKIHPIREELMVRLADHARKADEQPELVATVGPDIVFVPENAAHAKRMVEIATGLGTSLDVEFVEGNVLSGASGVAEVLDAAWTGVRSSLNQWTMSGRTPAAVVVQWPYGPTTTGILDAASAAGSMTVELVEDPPPVARLEESQSRACDVSVSSSSDLSALLESAQHGRTPMRRRYEVGVAALSAIEEYPNLPPDTMEIAAFKNRHAGERCVIIGNGPSLNELDLGRLRGENTIGVNGIFYAEAIDFPLTYYVVEDTSVMEENLEAIKEYRAGHKFFPTIYRAMYKTDEKNVSFFTMNRGFYAKESPNFCIPRFSTDASQRLYCGQSVTIINLQLAYYMGFREVYLIGMDFSYTIPDSAEREGDLITSTEDDPNHFHKDYFGKGKTWKDPKLDRVMNNYQLAKAMFEADGRAIFNATAGGKLEVFPRADFHEVFAK